MSLCGGPYGRLNIPMESNDAWLRAYSAELDRAQHSLFFCERRTEVFRMHFDLDFLQSDAVPLAYVVALVSAANSVFRSFFPGLPPAAEEWGAMILSAPPKSVERNGCTLVKSGYHVIWNKLYVNQRRALKLRANVVSLLERTWDKREECANSYHDVVDEVVLTQNGLRMYGSDKAVRCKVCKNSKSRASCVPCGGRGLLIENRAYTLSAVLGPDGEKCPELCSKYLGCTLECVRATSTRVSNRAPTPGYKVPDNAVKSPTGRSGRKRKLGPSSSSRGGGESGPRDCRLLDRSIPVYPEIAKRINATEKWEGLDVLRVFFNSKKREYLVHVSGPGSSYCRNVGRAHGSSGVYFMVKSTGIHQRCYSHKGTCRSYTSGVVSELKPWLREALFGVGNTITAPAPSGGLRLGIPVPRAPKSYPPIEQIHVEDLSLSQPHPDFPGMTRGEVDQIPESRHREVQAECFRKLPIASAVHALIMADDNGNPAKAAKSQ